MQLRRVDLNLFTVFEAIFRERGITAASKTLHLSQPAVSHALARLRELLGDPLFERHGNEMLPTPRARELAATIAAALGDLDKILRRVEGFTPSSAFRTFSVAMRDTHEAGFIAKMLQILERDAPGISISTVRIDRRDFEDDLYSGELDFAVDVDLPQSSELRRQCISAEPLVVLARKEHPSVRGAIDLATYLSLDHVLVTGRRRGRGFEDVALERLNATRRIRVRCQHHAAANEAVRTSNLLVTMPRNYAVDVNREGVNQMLPFPAAAPPFELFLYWHANVDEDPAHRWFRELAIKSL